MMPAIRYVRLGRGLVLEVTRREAGFGDWIDLFQYEFRYLIMWYVYSPDLFA